MMFDFLLKRHFSVASSSNIYERWFHHIHFSQVSRRSTSSTVYQCTNKYVHVQSKETLFHRHFKFVPKRTGTS